jgi:glycosyltransferase involved in cell wall biosynthesis
MPKISVVIPVYNRELYIEECVSSVLKQDFEDFELLIEDDGSTDKTRDIIKKFCDERIKFFYRDYNLGLFNTLNNLVQQTQSPLVRFLNSDDVMTPDCLAETTSFFERHPDINISFCKCINIDEIGREIGKDSLEDLPVVIKSQLSIQLFFYYGCIAGSTSNVCVKRKYLLLNGLFEKTLKFAGDYDMWVKICRTETLGIIRKHLIRVRIHPGQMSRSNVGGLEMIEVNKVKKRVYASFAPILPKEIYFWAVLYNMCRQDVLNANCCLRLLINGYFNDFFKIVRITGVGSFLIGLFCWLLTCNNRFYRPRPKFINTA